MATHQCGICETDCTGTRDIACDICNQWLHFACEILSEQEFIFLKKTSLSYMCYRCLYKDSTYNFDLELQCSSAAASQNLFDEAVHLERIFLRYEPPQVVSVDSVGLYHNLVQICFQNFNLVNKSSTTPPVMLGPMLLHWDGSFDSYHRFLSHLQSKLVDTDQSK